PHSPLFPYTTLFRSINGVDYQHTGEVRRIDSKGIKRLLDDRSIVLLPPMGYSPTGETFNLACEDIATRAAIELKADKLLLFSSEQGLLDSTGQLIRELPAQQAEQHIQRFKTHKQLEQAELLQAAVSACRGGVARCHIISY